MTNLESLFGLSAQRLHTKWMTMGISNLIELRKRMSSRGYGHTDTYRLLEQHIEARRHCERAGKEMNNPFVGGVPCPKCRGVIGCNDTSCSKCGHKVI